MYRKLGEEITVSKRVDPSFILLDELCGRLEEVTERLDKLVAFNKFYGPMTRMFKRERQYQSATIAPGQSGRVWFMVNPQPEILVGIITQVGHDWYADTYLEWIIDYDQKRIDYQIAPYNNPKHFERGIPFFDQVEWIAYNNRDENATFGVLTDGFFVPREVYDRIVNVINPSQNLSILQDSE